jgi:hypothetical protein
VKGTVVIEHKEDLHPQIVIVDEKSHAVLASYSIPAGAHVSVSEKSKVPAGTLLARTPRKIAKTKDITGGLPRVAELFEARKPKDSAEIAKIDGLVEIGGTVRGKRKVIVTDPDTGNSEEHLVPMNNHIIVAKDDLVKKGQQLTEGSVPPHDILDVLGPQQLQEHLVNEVQEVYRLQGVEISDKHIEIIIRQMLRKVKVTDPGDTTLLWGDQVDKITFENENNSVAEKAESPPKPCRFSSVSPRPASRRNPSSAPRASRTPPVSSPKPLHWAAWTTSAGSRRTSSWSPHPRRHRFPRPSRGEDHQHGRRYATGRGSRPARRPPRATRRLSLTS